ncbi:hypothetical protein DUNSADRAFT_9001 [Dunaliella salina]|uniref:PPIase cyclophilin-type domain-containing protein n=1 Tax=Dunaliella salina TaxID=3046 RepID=A0ABQ7GID3_DUNSA|nr:hypothetical protein DUNSADRAFT_9001 [Dunaliella salina]|eukprot:KAF5834378.1 hypothetical protein DUNSADRAFT_9001 [Dunaliella salina]
MTAFLLFLPSALLQGHRVPWTSGLLKKDYDVDPAHLPPANPKITTVNLETLHGTIRIQLEPSWSAESVTYLRHLAANPDLCTAACAFYRAEPGFLLQGSLKAYLPANKVTKPGPKLMERGDVGWAGGGPGPDWFVYLGTRPAAHFGTSHTVWGRIADEASFDVIEKIVQKPTTAPPGGMHMLDEHVAYTVKAG